MPDTTDTAETAETAETIEYEQFESSPAPPGQPEAPLAANAKANVESDLDRLSDIPMELAVEIGRTRMTVGETLQLHVGAVVELERQAGEPADLLVNGTAIARGEVVVIDERYGLRITEMLDGQQEPELASDGETSDDVEPSAVEPTG